MKLTIQILALTAGLAITAGAGSGVALAQTDAAVPIEQSVQPIADSASGLAPTYVAPAPGYASPPAMLGAVSGSTAADRDGDGLVDGYYSSDGLYHPNVAPTPMPAPNLVSRRGERG